MSGEPDYVPLPPAQADLSGNYAPARVPLSPSGHNINASHTAAAVGPKPLPSTLKPVAAFEPRFVPEGFRPWAMDIANRMQCPPDYVAIAAIVAAGGILGNRIGIKPKQRDDWSVTPNLWGMIVGKPGAMKSPAMSEALRQLKRMEADAAKENAKAMEKYEKELELYELKKSAAKSAAKKAIGGGTEFDGDLGGDKPEMPFMRRYLVTDTTYEKLGEILQSNPRGVTVYRDELGGLLAKLEQEENCTARNFFMTAWNGTDDYTFDRIGRGTVRIERTCLAMIGAIQPDVLARHISKASRGGGDGLMQRFSLAVWPDASTNWENMDCYPDAEAKAGAYAAFQRLDKINPLEIGATFEGFEGVPNLPFSGDAYERFIDWQTQHEADLRNGHLPPALEGHFAKYRKMIPALALIFHLADGATGPVSDAALERALWLEGYLKTHALRIYGAGLQGEVGAAKAILNRIKRRDLEDGFTARDIYQSNWAGLADREHVQAGLALLCDFDWLTQHDAGNGGRPKTIYRVAAKAWPHIP